MCFNHVLSLMSNLLFVGKTIAYMIQVLSLNWLMMKIWLMKKIWKGFNQQDVTRRPRGKVELWLCNGVQESTKIVIIQCINNLLKATLRKIRKTELSKKLVRAKQMRNLIGAKQVNEIQVIVSVEWQKHSWCRVIVSFEWQRNIVPSYCNMIYLKDSRDLSQQVCFLGTCEWGER